MPNNDIEKKLWSAADELRANSKLKSTEYAAPVLGLIFLRFADFKFSQAEKQLQGKSTGRKQITKADYQAMGVMSLPDKSRFSRLINLPESADIGKAINDAMKAIETDNEELRDVLPKNYQSFEKRILIELLKILNSIPMDIEGDTFGKIYEYFLGEFAMTEGQKGGEFFTPTAIVKLIVEVIEPYHGRIFDPACGSGGMFVQSAHFVERHKKRPSDEIAVYGQENKTETLRLCKLNLAVHGLSGEIKDGNTYYEDPHHCVGPSTSGAKRHGVTGAHSGHGKFDFVMANPPFNVDRVDKERIKDDPRFPFGMPKTDNANYLWIQIFYSALNKNGRAGFVMANSAGDARASELEIRKKLIESNAVDVIISIGSNFFYTVTLPCTLWFLDKGKTLNPTLSQRARGKPANRKDKVLFIDARHIYRQIDRAHRDFTPEQIDFIANIVRLYRGETLTPNPSPKSGEGNAPSLEKIFYNGKYVDVPGLCKVATLKEIEAQGWSLNPGRYVGVTERAADDFDFKEKLEELNEELEVLNVEARELEERIAENVAKLLEDSK